VNRPHPGAAPAPKKRVSVLLFAVPALLVVVLGYVIGHGLWTLVVGSAGAEPAGWLTGVGALAGVTWLAMGAWKRRRRRD
jgi:hypothetical protein